MKFKLRRYYLYYLARSAILVFYLMPIKIGCAIGAIFGRLAFLIAAKYRHVAIENLRIAFCGQKTEDEINRIALKAFESLGKNAVELINFTKISKSNIDRFVRIRNSDILDRAFQKGKGVIILTAHFGNWELVGAALRIKNYPGVVVVRKIYFDKYDRYLNYIRKIHDVNVIYRDESPKKILKVLKRNEIVGILADQDVDSVDGVFVNFFGRPAYTPIGPAAVAKASGASLIPTFIVREDGHHTLVMEEPIELVDTGNKEADIVTNTQRWSDVVESYIRRYPEQWVWMHRRWKTKENQA